MWSASEIGEAALLGASERIRAWPSRSTHNRAHVDRIDTTTTHISSTNRIPR
jgi:hypothetical protein